jgi:hypothetical protein
MRDCTRKRAILAEISWQGQGVGWIIQGAALTPALTLLANSAQAHAGGRASPFGDETLVKGRMAKRYARSPGASETPAM